MTLLPADGYISNAGRTTSQMQTALDDIIAVTRQMWSGSDGGNTVLAVTADTIIPVASITPMSASSTTNLTTLTSTNAHDGMMVMLFNTTPNNAITVKSTGHINLTGQGPGYTAGVNDFVLKTVTAFIVLKWDATANGWEEVWRDQGFTAGRVLFTSSGNFIVPPGVTQVKVTMIAGGGGGGGSHGSSGSGTSGNPGGNTVFDSLTASGGTQGFGSTSTRAGAGGLRATNVNPGQPGMFAFTGVVWEGGSGGRGILQRKGQGGFGGASYTTNAHSAGGAAGGQDLFEEAFAVVPAASLTVTIGSFGAGGLAGAGGGVAGQAGNSGAVLVEW